MSTLWLNRIMFISLGWLAVGCVTALLLGQLVNYGKRQEAKARQRGVFGRLQQQPLREQASEPGATAAPDLQKTAQTHDAEI